MDHNRRFFIKNSALLASGLMLGKYLTACNTVASATSSINKNFGLQLYTLRDVLPKDPVNILKQVASFGYKEIESYEGDKGMFWGMKNTEFKKLMDDLGMKIIASHCDIEKDFEKKAEEAAAIGMQYLLCAWLGPQKSLDDYKRAADTFNKRGEVCRKHGLRFAYHNHDYSFKKLDGQYPQDLMMQQTDKELVDYEMDIYWVVTAGEDPLQWFDRHPGRFTLSHIKDRKKNVPLSQGDASTILGTGTIDFPAILSRAKDKGMKHFLVEQELYEGTTPMGSVQANADYLKKLELKS